MDVRQQLRRPDPEARPTPLFWWSGASLDRDRLRWQLDHLAGSGVGGTIVGYTHRPSGGADHGDPKPFSAPWWELMRWFVAESGRRGLTVGCQDYNLTGSALRAAGASTGGHRAGQLVLVTEDSTGRTEVDLAIPQDSWLVTAHVASGEFGESKPADIDLANGRLQWHAPRGHARLSAVLARPPRLSGEVVSFDPLHPAAGQCLIDQYFAPFERELGDELGRTFRIFFQDELDLGLVMPMWNDIIAQRLSDEHGLDPARWLPGLWSGAGAGTIRFRAAYHQVVTEQLERAFFEPVFNWHEQHGTLLVMDQLSRGDLRSGHRHYGDFMRTMKWFHGPGNDDPDLTGPRQLAAFAVSASIAHTNKRPLVFNEAFYGSGWGVTPDMITKGLNAGFAAGATHVALHGLYYTTEGGWWEWAAPDFHFRQPWWRHSLPLWHYIAGVSSVLRNGRRVCDVAVVDPTADLALTGESTTAPETTREALTLLVAGGIASHLLTTGEVLSSSDGRLHVDDSTYQLAILPGMHALPEVVAAALRIFIRSGGPLVAVDRFPTHTEVGPLPGDYWDGERVRLSSVAELTDVVRDMITLDFSAPSPGVMCTRRRVSKGDVWFVTNSSGHAITGEFSFGSIGQVDIVDPWLPNVGSPATVRSDGSYTYIDLELLPGASRFICIGDLGPSAETGPRRSGPQEEISLSSPDAEWDVLVLATLDNRYGDVAASPDAPQEDSPVVTWHLDIAPGPAGPWTATTVGVAPHAWVLGPVPGDLVAQVDTALSVASGGGSPGPVPSVLSDRITWRPYAFAAVFGIPNDPLLTDWLTGPHGLKGLPREFLDPRVLDVAPPAGSAYYFLSTLDAGSGGPARLVTGSRAAMTVWLEGSVAQQMPGVEPRSYEPWGLLDLNVPYHDAAITVPPGRVEQLVRVVVDGGQPTRAAVLVVPGPSPVDQQAAATPGHLPWWEGERPALVPQVAAGPSAKVWIRLIAPPGAVKLVAPLWATVENVTIGGRELDDTHWSTATPRHDEAPATYEIRFPRLTGGDTVVVGLTPADGRTAAGVLAAPPRWQVGPTTERIRPWNEIGLQDFSGVVRYTRVVEVMDRPRYTRLRVVGLESTAAVRIDDHFVGHVLVEPFEVDVTEFLSPGSHNIEIEVANSLANHYARYPSPYSSKQSPSGGFTDVALLSATWST